MYKLRVGRNQRKPLKGFHLHLVQWRRRWEQLQGHTLIGGITASIQAFGKQELAQKKLEQALGKTSTALLGQARALQQVSMYGDEDIIMMQSMLASFVKGEDEIKALTSATLDLASGMGLDLKGAGDLVAKTIGSSTNAMSRYGIEVTGAVGSTERLETLTNSVATLFGGQAKAQSETMTGSIEQMKNAIGDTAEAIGKNLAPMVQNLAGWFKGASETASEFFLGLTETNLESTIRKLQEMGQETLDLELIQARASLIKLEKVSKGVREREVVQRELNESINAEYDAMKGIAEQQAKLVESGYTEEELRNLLNIIPLHRNYTSEQIKQIKNEQEKGKILLSDLNIEQAKLEIAEDTSSILNEELDKSIDLESSRVRILTLEEQIAEAKKSSSGDEGGVEDPIVKIVEQMSLEELHHETKLDQIKEQREKFIGLGVSEVEAQIWATEQIAELNVQKLESYEQYYRSIESGYDTMMGTILDMEMTGKIRRELIWKSMQQGFVSMLGDLLKEWIKNQLAQKLIGDTANVTAIITAKATATAIALAYSSASALVSLATAGANSVSAIAGLLATKSTAMGIASAEDGGLIGGNRHSQGGTIIEAEQGEFIMSRDAVNSYGVENMKKINNLTQDLAGMKGINAGNLGTKFTVREGITSGRYEDGGLVGIHDFNEMSQGGSSAPIVINISAPLVDESVIDHIIPAIERATRLGLA